MWLERLTQYCLRTSYISADTFEEGGYGRQQVNTTHQSAGTKPLACCRSVTILLERV